MVRFGSSGWRGVIGREITFRKVRILTYSLVDILQQAHRKEKLLFIVGYDTRMLSEKFAKTASEILTSRGQRVLLTARDIPTPVLAHAVRQQKADAGIMFTGSHNPPEYNGVKLYTSDGIPAPESFTRPIEEAYLQLEKEWDDIFLPQPQLQEEFNPKTNYLGRLQNLIDWETIRNARLKLVVDPLFGSTREYLDHILLENHLNATLIHNARDPFFGGYAPNCSSENLTRLREIMRREKAHLGLATDGDGDRFGILDQGARLCDSSHLIALILDYLIRRRGLHGAIGRSLATSCLIDAVAESQGLKVLEGGIGFKHFGPLLNDGSLEFAGEESAGLAWAKHLPERDGLLACLLTVEMVAREGKSLHAQIHALTERVGNYYFRRTQLPATEERLRLLELRRQQEWKELGGNRVTRVDRREGLKLIFNNGAWLLIREASTEPKIRLYAEGRSASEMRELMHQAKHLFTNWRI